MKDQFEQLFQSEKNEEVMQHKRFNEIGIINVSSVEPSVSRPLTKPVEPKLPDPTPVEPLEQPAEEVIAPVNTIEQPAEEVIPPVNLEPIKFQVGDRA